MIQSEEQSNFNIEIPFNHRTLFEWRSVLAGNSNWSVATATYYVYRSKLYSGGGVLM